MHFSEHGETCKKAAMVSALHGDYLSRKSAYGGKFSHPRQWTEDCQQNGTVVMQFSEHGETCKKAAMISALHGDYFSQESAYGGKFSHSCQWTENRQENGTIVMDFSEYSETCKKYAMISALYGDYFSRTSAYGGKFSHYGKRIPSAGGRCFYPMSPFVLHDRENRMKTTAAPVWRLFYKKE